MAVSNSLGSNVFDILLGLSLPWFLKTGVAYAGTTVSFIIQISLLYEMTLKSEIIFFLESSPWVDCVILV